MTNLKTRVNCCRGWIGPPKGISSQLENFLRSLDNSWDIRCHPKLYRMSLVPSLVLLLAVAATSAIPLFSLDSKAGILLLEDAEPQVRERRSAFPGRAMMFHGYFGHGGLGNTGGYPYHQSYPSSNGRSGSDPQGAMTAFAAGDAVSAGSSYYGNDCSNCGIKTNGNGHKKNGNGNGHSNGNGAPAPEDDKPISNGNGNGQPSAEEPEVAPYPDNNKKENEVPAEDGYQGDQPVPEEAPKDEPQPASAASPTPAASAPEGPKRLPADDTSSEEEDDYFVGRGKGRGRGTFYNSYFPMVFGAFPGMGGGRGGNDGADGGGAYNPGIATAIANSFSTGRGAVATSHATAYGGPQLVPNGYRKNGSRTRPH